MEVARLIKGYLNDLKKTKTMVHLTFVIFLGDVRAGHYWFHKPIFFLMFFLDMEETLKTVFSWNRCTK